MGKHFDRVRLLARNGQYLIGQHASERLDERGVLEWQVVDGLQEGTLMKERQDAMPHPAVEVRQLLADGTEVKAVWSLLIGGNVAKLVTVHFFDE